MSDTYRIGFYNNKIEDDKGFEDFNIVFDNFEKLKKHLRKDDVITLKSEFSIFDIDIKEMLNIIKEYNLKIEFLNYTINADSAKNLMINILLAMFQFIKDNKNVVKKLLN